LPSGKKINNNKPIGIPEPQDGSGELPDLCGSEVKGMKIYVRERQKVGEGVESPKYRIIAVTGGQIQINATHFRKFEIEQIARDGKAEVVFMKPVDDEHKKKQK
jgi:hypothetical protein